MPFLEGFNKIDLRPDAEPRIERDAEGRPVRVLVSARLGIGLDLLMQAISERVRPPDAGHDLQLPPAAARLRAQLFAHHAVRSERMDESGNFHLRVTMPYERLRGLCMAAGVRPPKAPRVIEEWELSS